jgi:transcriptional regulator with XRE-family HTH domain
MKIKRKRGRPKRHPVHSELPKLMRQLRHSRCLSLRKLGKKLPFTRATLSYWETGGRTPEYDNANRFLVALGASNNERVRILRALMGFDPYGANETPSDLI